jgi:acetyltransferase-like isoleucine patch superfamily enzyme
MSKATPVQIPLVNVNDDTVKLTAWLVKDGDEVREGQHLAEIETSKALVELIAPASGLIRLRYSPGEELPVGAIVAYIGEEEIPEMAYAGRLSAPANQLSASAALSSRGALPVGTRFSKKALELLERHRVSPQLFADLRMVREQDVLDHLDKSSAGILEVSKIHHSLRGISLDGLSFPAISLDQESGRVDPQFLMELRNNADAFANLASEEKCKIYRENGARVGENVQLGKGTVIIAPRIEVGDGVQIGAGSSLILRERFTIGNLSSFREGLSIRGGTVILGSNVFAGSRIQIGGGGNNDPWALLVVGDGVYLGDDLFINICRPVLVGKEVYLTQRSILVTHNIGHSILEGYENAFAPIVLEDFAQVGMNSTLYAGSRIGHSAIVASNSYLISSIPKGKLAMGVPAVVVRDAARKLDRKKQLQMVETMVRQLQEQLILKGFVVSKVETVPMLYFTLTHERKKFQVAFVEAPPFSGELLAPVDEVVLWTFDSRSMPVPSGGTLIDLLAKTISGPDSLFANSVREFLRKRGIRLEPGPWRFQKGLF